jgi:hypothetical protein
MGDDTYFPGARPHLPSSTTHLNTTAKPQHHQPTNTTSIPQSRYPTDTTVMPFINFETGPNYYGYEEGVNIANLTLKDINKANSRLAPMRQRRIDEGLLRATRDDPGFISSTPAATKRYCDYAQWTKTELLEAMIARGVATKKARLRDM